MSWRRSPLPRDWRRRRQHVLERDGWRCRIRGPRCARRATEVDHVGDREDHSERNLRAACGPCHRERTARQARAVQASQYRPREPHPGVLPEVPDPYTVANGWAGPPASGREGVTPQVGT